MTYSQLKRPDLIPYTCREQGSDINKNSFLHLYMKLYPKQKKQEHIDGNLIQS